MKIWIVTEIFWPSETSTGLILSKISEWISTDFQVEIITVQQKEKLKSEQFIYGKITYVQGLNQGNPLLKQFLGLLFTIKAVLHLRNKVGGNDIIFITSNPPFSPLIFPHFFKGRIVYLFHDVFPENLLQKLTFIPSKLKLCCLTLVNRSFRKIDKAISIGEDMSQILLSKGIKRVFKITNWPENHIIALPYSDLSCIRLLYAGNIGPFQGLDKVVDWFKEIKDPTLELIIQGEGKKKIDLIARVTRESISNITFKGAFRRQEQNRIFSEIHFGIVSLEDFMFGLGVPSKFYNLIHSGRPILYFGPKYTEIYNEIREHNLGLIADEISENPSKAIQLFLATYAADSIRNYSQTKYSESIIKDKYLTLLHEISQ